MRVTGGVHRSRPLRAPRGAATRPTSDRVREALFAVLGSRRAIEGERVLDLYAGTGALAIEALSRGAGSATLVESARPALDAIRANVEELGLHGRAHVIAGAVERRVAIIAARGPFDVVFADPPYALVTSGAAVRALGVLVAAGALSNSGILILEHGKAEASPDIPGLALTEGRRYGDTMLSFYGRSAGEA